MAKRKNGPNIIIEALKFSFGTLKWFVLALIGVFSFLFRKGADIRAERRRPAIESSYSPFEELEAKEGSLAKFESELYSGKSLIGLVIGARGSGKSAIGLRMLENAAAKGFRTYAMGFKKETLPKWIIPVSSPEEVKPNSFLLVDEGGIAFSSRNSMSEANKLLSELLFISRHKDLSVLFITQNSATIEVNTLRQIDYLVLKQPSLLQLDFERKKIRDVYTEAKSGFGRHAGNPGLAYLYAHNYRGFISNSLPSFWSAEVSKAYRDK